MCLERYVFKSVAFHRCVWLDVSDPHLYCDYFVVDYNGYDYMEFYFREAATLVKKSNEIWPHERE